MNRHAATHRVGGGLPHASRALAILLVCAPTTLLAGDDGRYEAELGDRINAYRAARNLKPLERNGRLDQLATQHSRSMAKARRMSHDGFDARFKASGFRRCVENVGWNSPTPEAQIAAWRASPPHDRNLLDADATVVGLGEAQRYTTMIACR